MAPSDDAMTSESINLGLIQKLMKDDTVAPLIHVLFRLTVEVEALREALSSPGTPESVRQGYRRAYARIAVLSHNSAGVGGTEKVLNTYFPRAHETAAAAPYASERMMMRRLGATEEEIEKLCRKMDEVSMYT